MKRLMVPDVEIHLVTGHMGSGKSHYFRRLLSLPEYQGPKVFVSSKDDIYVHYFGARTGGPVENNADGHLAIYNAMTPRERSYADEILRVDTERAILVSQVEKVLLDVGMRTRRTHQKPFVAMVSKVEDMLSVVAKQRAKQLGLLPPEPTLNVNLRVVFLFCNFETMRRRMEERWPGCTDNGALPAPLIETVSSFEVPNDYKFLAINTSGESDFDEQLCWLEIKRHFSGLGFPEQLFAARAEEAKRCLADAKRKIRQITTK